MLLHDLTIENYRSFAKYKLNNLARVNLLVGDNNCGKTSVLEAIHILIANGKMECALETLGNRDEIKKSARSKSQGLGQSKVLGHPDVMSWFHRSGGRSDFPRTTISLQGKSSSGVSTVSMNIEFTIDQEPERLVTQLSINNVPIRRQSVKLDADGLASGPIDPPKKPDSSGRGASPPPIPRHLFIPLAGMSASRMSRSWNPLIPSKGERVAVEVLNAVFPEINSIQFESDTRSRADIWVDTDAGRFSVSDMGGGVGVSLAMAIGLASSKSGILLIDEIDTGLHHTRLANAWRMIIKKAEDLDIQIFATTHSLDCVRALAAACNLDETLRDHVALFGVDRRMDEAVRYGADELAVVVDHEIEVR